MAVSAPDEKTGDKAPGGAMEHGGMQGHMGPGMGGMRGHMGPGGMRGGPGMPGGPGNIDARLNELNHKLDAVLREVRELRRQGPGRPPMGPGRGGDRGRPDRERPESDF